MSENFLRIMGVDPSLRNTGLASGLYSLMNGKMDIHKISLIQTEADKTIKNKGKRNLKSLIEPMIEVHRWAVEYELAFSEITAGGQDANSASALGMALGISASIGAHTTLIGVTPVDVKKAALNKNAGSKGEMIEWAMGLYPDLPWPMRKSKGRLLPVAGKCEHMADAIGVIHAGLQSAEFLLYISERD